MIRRFRTAFGEIVYLPDERWVHIVDKHPEIKRYITKIREVLIYPDIVKLSKKDGKSHLYYKFFPEIYSGKYLLVVVKHNREKFIVTCFVTDKIKEGEVKWQKE